MIVVLEMVSRNLLPFERKFGAGPTVDVKKCSRRTVRTHSVVVVLSGSVRGFASEAPVSLFFGS